MRLSKRQLKRIIREEYSRLKRRGLIREAMSANPDLMNMASEYADSLCDEGGEEQWVYETLGYIFEEVIEEYSASVDEEGVSDDPARHVEELFRMYDAYTVIQSLCHMHAEIFPGSSCDRYLQDFIGKVDSELGGIYS